MPAMPLIYRWYGQRSSGIVPEDPCACTGTREDFLCRYSFYEPATVTFCDNTVRNVQAAVTVGLSVETIEGSCGAYRVKDQAWIFHYTDFDATLDKNKRAKSITDEDGNVWTALNTVFRSHSCTFKVTSRCIAIDANLDQMWNVVEVSYQKGECGTQQLIEGTPTSVPVAVACKTGFEDLTDRQRHYTSEWELTLDPAMFDGCQQWENYRFLDGQGNRYKVVSNGVQVFGNPVTVDIREDRGD
jgi:hypothetical protein